MVTTVGTMADLSIVWAKIKGYPWWPATVNLSCLRTGEPMEDSKEKFKVFFVGETTHAELAGNMMRPFRAHFDKFSRVKSSKLQQAVRMAETLEEQISFSKSSSHIDSATTAKVNSENSKTQPQQQPNPSLLAATVRKSPSREHQEDSESLPEIPLSSRKSTYRESNNPSASDFHRIPFRKFEEITLEGKIVDCLNKMNQGKHCPTELSRIINKAKKIRTKDLTNRFVVSGMRMLGRVVDWQHTHSEPYNTGLIADIHSANKQLRQKVLKHLSDVNLVSDIEEQSDEQFQRSAIEPNKKLIVRAIYRILRMRIQNLSFSAYKSMAVRLYESFEGAQQLHSKRFLLVLARVPTEVQELRELVEFIRGQLQQQHC